MGRSGGGSREGQRPIRCLVPRGGRYIELSFPEAETEGGVWRLTERTPLRVGIASEQPPRRVAPIPRAFVFIFVDGILVERNLDGYVPYQWVLDPVELGPGEHVVTAFLGWREDHFGVRHVRVNVEES